MKTSITKKTIHSWPDHRISGAKRANLACCCDMFYEGWFFGYGKDQSCHLEGTWWDMICLARNILASENTKLAAPEYYHPEWENDNYLGEEIPYEFVEEDSK